MKALIALEDGTVFYGESFGAAGEAAGEVVFNTSMTGYQEILTDPSYKGQIVTMTYPLIGNYGINPEDIESGRIQVEGFIVKEMCRYPSNFRSKNNISEYLAENNIMGITGIDTRALTRHIRVKGAMKGIISTADLNEKSLVQKAKNSPGLVGRDLVREVTCEGMYNWGNATTEPQVSKCDSQDTRYDSRDTRYEYKVIAIDCGIKFNILRMLSDRGCNVTVVPASTDADTILRMRPDGLFLSNGPGDPEGVPYVYKTVRQLIDKLPIFGICLGHQMLGLALGAKTYKLKFGHRGANHPVKNLKTGRIEITVQNHGFCVDADTLPKGEAECTHINLNDNTCEGLRHKKYPVFSVQYHPESSPGPHDSGYLFDEFIGMMKRN